MIYAISTFKLFKLAGTAGIVPAVLQQRVGLFMSYPNLKTFLPTGYIPKAWRQVKVMIIRRLWIANYTKAKACSPFILLTFMLKMIEKLVNRHIRDKILGRRSVHRYQFSQQLWKTTASCDHVYKGSSGKHRRYTWSIPKY
jgi:hypothetical protein